MANEFKHKTVGTELTQTEWEAIGAHVLNSQATDDLIVAVSATQLSRLAVAASRIIGKKSSGGVGALTAAEIRTIINVANGATAYVDADAVSAVEAAGLTFAENKGIILDAVLSADGKYSGFVEAGTAGATIAFGDIVYLLAADSEWYLTDADAEATAGPVKIGICVEASTDGNTTTILLWGKVRADAVFPTLTISAPAYIGVTPGDIQVAAPTGTDDILRIIGYGNTANTLFFCPDNTYIKLA